MLEINLLPDELKAKPRKEGVKINIETKYFLYLVPFVIALLILAHLYLAVVGIAKSASLAHLNKKWEAIASDRKKVEIFNMEYAVSTADTNDINKLLSQRVGWAEKLNKLSLKLPSGIWFSEFSVTSRDLKINASVVSLQKDETGLIKGFIDNLKNDPGFYKDFKSLELSSIHRRTVGGYDIVDFVLSGELKEK